MSASASPTEPQRSLHLRGLVLAGSLLAGLVLNGCSGSGSSSSDLNVVDSGVQLIAVHQGKLVDVYGLRTVQNSQVIDLYQTDMIVGLDIQDERDSGSNKRDSEILYDFVNANPDTLQPRLLITREIGSKEFEDAIDALDTAHARFRR